jgi:hypothetical protein
MVSRIYAHVGGKVKSGGATVHFGRFQTQGYRHRINAIGGFDVASCSLQTDISTGERLFYEGLGNVIQFYPAGGNGLIPIWEGYINRITYRVGGIAYTAGLDDMANRVRVTYYNADSAAAQKTEQTVVVNDDYSQLIYGVKEANIDAGIHYNNGNKTHKTVLRDTIKSIKAWPQISTAPAGGSDTVIEIECKGFYYFAWDWLTFSSTNTTLFSPFNLISLLCCATTGIGGLTGENAQLIYAVNTGGGATNQFIEANAAFLMSAESKSGQTYLQFIQSIVEGGDGTEQYVIGITPYSQFTPTRYCYYRRASQELRYTTKGKREDGVIRNRFGAIIPGYEVVPDCFIQITDNLQRYAFGGSGGGDDPSLNYLSSVEYDGDTGKVSWQSGDNITMEGAIQEDRYFRRSGQRFGAPLRQTL